MVGKDYSVDTGRPHGILVVGMGDEKRGDGGVGIHLVNCLRQMDWPSGVHFSAADDSIPQRAARFAKVFLLDALEGPAGPGTLYQMDPEELISNADDQGHLGLLTMLPKPVLKRVAVFGVHPRTSSWGAPLSQEVLASLSMLLTYLRTRILSAARELTEAN